MKFTCYLTILSCTYYLTEAEMKIAMFSCFKEYHGNHKKIGVYMILGDAVSNLETLVWILNRISRSITWSLFSLKASYLVKWPISTWSFMWWCQFIDLLKFETRPSCLLNLVTVNYFVLGVLGVGKRSTAKYQCNYTVTACTNDAYWLLRHVFVYIWLSSVKSWWLLDIGQRF